MKNFYSFETGIGRIGVEENEKSITRITIVDSACPPGDVELETALLREAEKQLLEYLDGIRQTFDLPLEPKGTPFQQIVWQALLNVPYGETRSYGDIAKNIRHDKAARAVGMANNKNPLPIVIPCHRVIGANGRLVGYAGGLGMKEHLLALEKQHSR